MPAKTSSEARAAILALHGIGLTSRRIVDALKKQNYVVSKSTVTSVIRDLKNAEAGIVKPPRKIPPQNLPSVRTKELISKIKKELGKPTQLSKRQMAKKYEVSVNTINRIIKLDLKGEIIYVSPEKKSAKTDSDDEKESSQEVEKKKEKKQKKSKKSSKSDNGSSSSSRSKSSKRKSLKTKIPKVRRRKDSSEREPEMELLEPDREISEDS